MPDQVDHLGRQDRADALDQLVDRTLEGQVCGQSRQKEQEREERKDEVVAQRRRRVGDRVVHEIAVHALEKDLEWELASPEESHGRNLRTVPRTTSRATGLAIRPFSRLERISVSVCRLGPACGGDLRRTYSAGLELVVCARRCASCAR